MLEFTSDLWNRPELKTFEIQPYHSIEKVLRLFQRGIGGRIMIEADFGFHIKWNTPTVEKWRQPLLNATRAMKFIHTYSENPEIFSKYDIEIEYSVIRKNSSLVIDYYIPTVGNRCAFIIKTGIQKSKIGKHLWEALFKQYGYFLKELATELGTLKANEVCLAIKDLLDEK